MLVTTLIAAFVLFSQLIDAHKVCFKLSVSHIYCIWMDVCAFWLSVLELLLIRSVNFDYGLSLLLIG